MDLLAARVALLFLLLVLGASGQAQTFTTLYKFTGGSDGAFPYAGLIQDQAGNLYGTASSGGDLNCGDGYGCGVVYKLDTAGTETVLYSFIGYPSDGEAPQTPVVRDNAGNIYGTTASGGSTHDGTVFKVDSTGKETVLYSFTGQSDGCWPYQGLVRDKAGNSYGTTYGCGSDNAGTIFKVGSAGNFAVLHSFAGYPSDGGAPQYGHLTIDKFGNLYGVTSLYGSTGCIYGCGVLYELSKKGKLTVLRGFAGGTTDGCFPYGSVVQDKSGNLYGTAHACGSYGYGTIWKVSKKGKETILHNFAGGTSDGCYPLAGITRDSKGNLYGVTDGCGANGYGTLYELSAKGTLTLLHSFDYSDGEAPDGEVLRTAKGTLFGTTAYGGKRGPYCDGYDCGTVWKYVP